MSTTQTLTAQASAPGKLILFGEHSVVYGEPAIAASLSDLRIQVSAKTRSDGIVDIELPDLPDGLRVSIKAESLRCDVSNSDLKSTPTAQDAIDIHKCLQDEESWTNSALSESHIAAVTPLIYLFNKLVPSLLTKDAGLSISATSINLPVGAGLGSSAAFGVSASAALYQLHLRLRLIHGESDDKNEASTSATWKGKPSNDQLTVINELAYQSEILIHGTPSGIDNTVSTYGSAIHFTKLDGGKTRNERIDAKCLPPLHVILTNTQVPRSTKVLVSHVREFKKEYPLVVEGILNAMGGIARSFHELCKNSTNEDATRGISESKRIAKLIETNQYLLSSLGVSHPSLDTIVQLSKSLHEECKSTTKLTGAGGGGCCFTYLEEDEDDNTGLSVQERLDKVRRVIEGHCEEYEFKCFTSLVGGDGVIWL